MIVHCKKHPFDEYIGRGNPERFGNPFVIGVDGTRAEVIEKHLKWLQTGETFGHPNATDKRRQWVLDNLHLLRGKTLGCWCDYPKQDCHGRNYITLLKKMFGEDFMEGECNGHNMYDHDFDWEDGADAVCRGPEPAPKKSPPPKIKKGLKTVIAGSRDIKDIDIIYKAMDLCSWDVSEVVCGGADGVDALGEQWAEENDKPIKMFNADWDNLNDPGAVIKTNSRGKKYNAVAGHQRNEEMAKYADALVVVIREGSKGSMDMLERAKKHNLKILVIQRWN